MAIAFGLVTENCDITIDELCVLLAAEGIEAALDAWRFLLAQGLGAKKAAHAAEQERPRRGGASHLAQPYLG